MPSPRRHAGVPGGRQLHRQTKKLAKDLLRAIGPSGARPTITRCNFNTEVSLNVSQDDELLELLRAAVSPPSHRIESPRKASLQETKKTQNMRGDLIENVRKIQSYGIQVQAGMIVGFDHGRRLDLRGAVALHPRRAHSRPP